jgi:hypothetical protein
MKAFERSCEDADEPIPLSFLKGVLHHYATSIDTRGNCIHEQQYDDILYQVFMELVEDGAFYKHPQSGLRVLASKINWYD